MPNPKRRHSKARRDRRRAHDHLKPPGPEPLPELPRAQAAAPRLPALRPLQGQARDRRGRGSLAPDGGLAAPVRVASTRMGGDHGPRWWWKGPSPAARELGIRARWSAPEARVSGGARAGPARAPLPIDVVDAPEVVGMGEKVTRATLKRRSSIQVALELVRDGRADAFFSAGNTAACWTIAKSVLGTLPEVDRPGAGGGRAEPAGPHGPPRRRRERPLQGAPPRGVRGHGQRLHPRRPPRRPPARRAHEHGRGGDQGQRAIARGERGPASGSRLNFVGNVEGHDVFSGELDVVVMDGFTGNVVLKTARASPSPSSSLAARGASADARGGSAHCC